MLGRGVPALDALDPSSGHRSIKLEGLELSHRSELVDRPLMEEDRGVLKASSNGCDLLCQSFFSRNNYVDRRDAHAVRGGNVELRQKFLGKCSDSSSAPLGGRSGNAAQSRVTYSRAWRRRSRYSPEQTGARKFVERIVYRAQSREPGSDRVS